MGGLMMMMMMNADTRVEERFNWRGSTVVDWWEMFGR